MRIEKTAFKDLLIIQPQVFQDERGYFFESFNESKFRVETGLNITFVQDNQSKSAKHVLRGLHLQMPPKSQAKLIQVISGAILDVVVDLRQTQPTFGQHYKIELSADNKTQLFVPEGFAHGFVALQPDTIISYKCTNYYSAQHDRSILWSDKDLGIDWGVDDPLVSQKDQNGIPFSQFEPTFF